MKNYYEILEIRFFSDIQAVKKAYRRLVKTVHPDLNPFLKDGKERFMEYQNAYRLLTNPLWKIQYDRHLSAALTVTKPAPVADAETSKAFYLLSIVGAVLADVLKSQLALLRMMWGWLEKGMEKVITILPREFFQSKSRDQKNDHVEEFHECWLTAHDAEYGCVIPMRMFGGKYMVRIPRHTEDGVVLEIRHPKESYRIANLKISVLKSARPVVDLKVPLTDQLVSETIAFNYLGKSYALDLKSVDWRTRLYSYDTFDVRLLVDDERAVRNGLDESSETTLNNFLYYRGALR